MLTGNHENLSRAFSQDFQIRFYRSLVFLKLICPSCLKVVVHLDFSVILEKVSNGSFRAYSKPPNFQTTNELGFCVP